MPTLTLLTQKLFVPTLPARRVVRVPLLQRLDAGLTAGRGVTLISAPAGYGKSTLAAEWAAHTQRPVAWLSLDESDDTPRHFFTYFIAALQRVDPALGADLQTALAVGQLPPPPLLTVGLVNDLTALDRPCLCVLDDFQVIQDPAILSVLQGILAHQPDTLHLILVTREDPGLPLARLRASNQLTEIRAADLRFDETEIQRFLGESMGVSLSAADLARLAERTEGWIAGLQLAGLSLQGRSDPSAFIHALSGSHRFILSYLTEEVLKAQPLAVQDFLLQTALLSRLTGDLCDAVTGQSGSAALLEELLAANLFLIPLDDEGRWYRYHHLFAELLRHQLMLAKTEAVPDLHRRARDWYERHGMPDEAIEHSLAAADFAHSVELIEAHGWHLLNQGYAGRMERWVNALPPQWRAASPRTNLDFAWMRLLRGRFGDIPPYLQQAQTALAQLDPTLPATRDLQAECLALQANLLQTQGNVPESMEAASRALTLVAPDNVQVIALASLALGAAQRQAARYAEAVTTLGQAIHMAQAAHNLITEMLAFAHLGTMAIQYGRLNFVAQLAAPYQERMEREGATLPPVVGAVQICLGMVHYLWNRLDRARSYFEQAYRMATFSGHTSSVISAKLDLSLVMQAKGEMDGAKAAVAEAVDLLVVGAPQWVKLDTLARQADLLLALGDLDGAGTLLGQTAIGANTPVTHRTDPVHLVWLKLLAATDRTAALALARRILASAQVEERNGTALHALIAAALLADDEAEGRAWLDQAVALAEPEGYVRPFLDQGSALASLLAQAGHTQLLAHFPNIPPTATTDPDQTGLIEPMSERELEVLELLGQGLKYGEIADELVVSLNTVRFHVKGIYGKLGVNRQAHAVRRAQEMGIL